MLFHYQGYTRPVAANFVTQDTKSNIKRFLELFIENYGNEIVSGISTVFVDKDQEEIAAIREVMPGAQVLLCWFHVPKSFKTQVAQLVLPQADKKILFSALVNLTYSYDEDVYKDHMYDLMNAAPKDFYLYYMNNWDNIKPMWVRYHRKMQRTLGNNTTNRLEALNRSLKALFKTISRTRMKFPESVDALLRYLASSDIVSTYREYLNTEKTPYVNFGSHSKELSDIGKVLTMAAIKLLATQFNKPQKQVSHSVLEQLGVKDWVVIHTETAQRYFFQ